jgi:hypothetical protein
MDLIQKDDTVISMLSICKVCAFCDLLMTWNSYISRVFAYQFKVIYTMHKQITLFSLTSPKTLRVK